MSGNNAAAADLFLELAAFWRLPDQDFWDAISDGTIDTEISERAELAGPFPNWRSQVSFEQILPPLETLQSFFIRCFIGTGKKTAFPVESIYKKWTDDPTTRLAIAGSTGYLMGDSALHSQYLLDHYGFSVPPEYRMMPDHLALLLELAAYLLRNRTEGEIIPFLSQHFDWIDKLSQSFLMEVDAENAQDRQAQCFYELALQMIQLTVDCLLTKYSRIQK